MWAQREILSILGGNSGVNGHDLPLLRRGICLCSIHFESIHYAIVFLGNSSECILESH